MELTDAIRGRRSIRKYSSEPIAHEVLEEILEAAAWAPSAQNLQPWYLLAVTNAEDLSWIIAEMGTHAFSHRKRLEERFVNNPEVVEETLEFLTAMGGASTVVLAFLYKPDYTDHMVKACQASVSAAMENLCLAAYDKGIGSCWVEEFVRIDEAARARFCPDKGALLGGIVLGYPAVDPAPIKRKPGRWAII